MKEYTVQVTKLVTKWYLDGELHREDGPAVECSDGTLKWYLDGELHREDGPAVECSDGLVWYLNGELHRDGGPAVERSDGLLWYINGELHRDGGPAVECSDGCNRWFINGKEYSKKEYNKQVNSCDGQLIDIDGQNYKLQSIKERNQMSNQLTIKDIFQSTCELLDEQGYSSLYREEYSGRGMYGDSVPAIVTNAPAVLVGSNITMIIASELEDIDLLKEYVEDLVPMNIDNMGRDEMVFY